VPLGPDSQFYSYVRKNGGKHNAKNRVGVLKVAIFGFSPDKGKCKRKAAEGNICLQRSKEKQDYLYLLNVFTNIRKLYTGNYY